MTTPREKLVAAIREYLAERKIPAELVMYVALDSDETIHVELLEDGVWVNGD